MFNEKEYLRRENLGPIVQLSVILISEMNYTHQDLLIKRFIILASWDFLYRFGKMGQKNW